MMLLYQSIVFVCCISFQCMVPLRKQAVPENHTMDNAEAIDSDRTISKNTRHQYSQLTIEDWNIACRRGNDLHSCAVLQFDKWLLNRYRQIFDGFVGIN